jgi:hypothetical protein
MGKDLEGSSRIVKVLSKDMYGENEENQENPARVAGVSFDI